MSPAALVQTLRKRLSKPTGYQLFDIHLKQRIALSPSLTRFVFTGEDVPLMHTLAPDQRVKLFFPSANGSAPDLPKVGDWQAARRALKPEHAPPMRTYTIRALRPDTNELDIDFVLHGETGPASRWAVHARPGDPLQIVAPNAAYHADPGGYEWMPPQGVRKILLIGDETALPAIARRLEGLAANRKALVVIEVENGKEQQTLESAAQVNVIWVLREGGKDNLLTTVRQLQVPKGNLYAWVATETKVSRQIRRVLLDEHGLNEQFVKAVGYWRAEGSAEE